MRARPKVLYVDDEEQNLVVFRRSFEGWFDVSTIGSSSDAMALLERHEFAIVIADQRMPQLSGSELLAAVRARQPDAVTMMVTAYPSFENAVEAINRGHVVRYLRKPWNADEMRRALDDGVHLFESRRENRLLRERLIEEEHHVVIGQLASGLVHELANIGAVLAIIENVVQDWGKGIDLSEELLTLRSGIDKYWALVGSLKFCGSGKNEIALAPELRDVNEVMRDAFDLANHFPAVRSLAKFEIEPCSDALACVDATALFHALLNLLKNAAEACPPSRGEVRLRAKRSDGALRIEVQDTGPGIAEDVAPKILDGFYSTKGSSGTGIGLLVTRRIIEAHGGRLEFENLPEAGCIFSIILPSAKNTI